MPRCSREAARLLRATAQEQGSYFTAKQASYGYPPLEYHVSNGAFGPMENGLFSLNQHAGDQWRPSYTLSLLSRNRADEPKAVVPHESALVLHELTEMLSDRVHLTVPPGFRRDLLQGLRPAQGGTHPSGV